MNWVVLLALLVVIGVAGCTMPTEDNVLSVAPPTRTASVDKNTKPTVQVTLVEVPDLLTMGEVAQFTWRVEGATNVEHTNIHTSFTADFTERTDTEKQSGEDGVYSDSLVLESDRSRTVYIKAHASADGNSYESEFVTKRLESSSDENTAQVKKFSVNAFQFGFNPDPITVKVGDRVQITFTSDNTTHGIIIEEFGVVTPPITPENPQVVEFTADKTGTFTYKCNVFCGVGHNNMAGRLIVTE